MVHRRVRPVPRGYPNPPAWPPAWTGGVGATEWGWALTSGGGEIAVSAESQGVANGVGVAAAGLAASLAVYEAVLIMVGSTKVVAPVMVAAGASTCYRTPLRRAAADRKTHRATSEPAVLASHSDSTFEVTMPPGRGNPGGTFKRRDRR